MFSIVPSYDFWYCNLKRDVVSKINLLPIIFIVLLFYLRTNTLSEDEITYAIKDLN